MTKLDAGTALVGGDAVFTGTASRVEIKLDSSNFIRLGADSEIRLRQLGERSFQIDVVKGVVSYSMLKGGEADVDLQTANANVVPQKYGVYRVEARDKDNTFVVVRKGAADVLMPERTVQVKAGKSMTAREYAHGARNEVASAPPKDAFDEWSYRRDKIMDDERGPVYARNGWYPGRVHVGLGWGWGPYWDPFWGPYWGSWWGGGYGYYSRPTVIVRGGGHFGGPGHGGGGGHGGGHR